jgi:predicted permease
MTPPTTPLWRRYLRITGPDVAADVEAELNFHLEMLVDENVARGMTPEEARRAALARFGERGGVERECRELGERQERSRRRTEWVDALWSDLRFAVRQLRVNRGFTAVAVLTLALGIGGTTAIFSAVHSVLLRPLPYADADRMVVLQETSRGEPGPVSAGHFSDWGQRTTSYEAIAALDGFSFNLAPPGAEPERVYGGRVTPAYFQVVSMRPALGRYFLPGEDQPGRDRVAVLSHPLWTRMGADPGIVGKPVRLNGEVYTVVGVAPAAYTLSAQDEALWVPLVFTPEQRGNYGAHGLLVLGKLKPGVTRERAEEELMRVTRGINGEHPEEAPLRERSARLQDFHDMVLGGARAPFLVLLVSVGFVLLLAVVNVANLLLARAQVRAKEISIRAALGAGQRRIVRQLLTESVVLSLAGGVAGLLVAWLGIRLLVRMVSEGVPRMGDAALSVPVLAFAFVVAVGSGVLFGLAPALRVTRTDLQGTLREGGRTGSMGTPRDRLRRGLVVAELALALVLLVGAGLTIRSSLLLNRVHPGFDPTGVLSATLSLPEAGYPDAARMAAAQARLVEELRAVPGVQSAGAVNWLPLASGGADVGLQVEGRTWGPGEMPQVDFRVVTPGYLETMRIPLRAGRLVGEGDHATAPKVVVISEELARRLWPGENAVGKRVGCCTGDPPEWREVVGVVGSVRHHGLEEPVRPEMYVPFRQTPFPERTVSLVARGANPAALPPALRRAVRAVDPTLALSGVQTMDDVVEDTLAGARFAALLLTGLALVGLMLAVMGIYGVISYFVSQRTHEIGVRLALGATARDVVRLVVREGVVMGATGLAVGAVAALAVARLLRTLLFGVTTADPVVLAASCAVLFGAALLASYLPARRAARVDPQVSLR